MSNISLKWVGEAPIARGVVILNWLTRPPTPITGTFLTSKPFILRRLLLDLPARSSFPGRGVPPPIRAFTAAYPLFPMALKILLNDPELSLFLDEASEIQKTNYKKELHFVNI